MPPKKTLLRRLLGGLCGLALSSVATAQLVITEINSSGTPGDFWELTNYGASSVDLSGYTWDDESANPADASALTLPANTFIAAGESVIFSTDASPETFRAAWNLPGSVQVFSGGPGLGQDDRVYLYNAANLQVATLGYAAGAFTRSDGSPSLGGHAGPSAGGSSSAQSMILDPNFGTASPRYIFASGGNFDSYAANAPYTGIGSPGRVGQAGTNSAPVFDLPTTAFWTSGLALTNSNFRVSASDTDPNQTASVFALSKPDWLSLISVDASTFRLGGTPPAPGDYTFTVRAIDDAGAPRFTDQTFTLSVFPASSPIFLNEFNAVDESEYLNGGSFDTDEDLNSPGPTDDHFGRVLGNGGQWMEFVVVGDGSAGSTVDMRGWTIEIDSLDGSSRIVLSQHPYWADVRAGTLLTFIGNNTADGGLDTQIHRTSALHGSGGGFLWTNIHVGDPVFVDQSASELGDNLGIGSDETRVEIRNQADSRIYGPAGEGVAADSLQEPYGVSGTEVLRLEGDPTTNVNPLSGPYDDASSPSTFGGPNRWGSTGASQSFAAFVSANSPPTFTSAPPDTRISSSFNYAITTSDPNGNAVTLSAPSLPDFLTLTPGTSGSATLGTNRALTLADAGEHRIELIADDGQATANTTPQTFILNVFHHSPSVILNEYNAVASDEFFNGGDLSADEDLGAASADQYFGRVPGNGGNWFELVVTGDGGASTVDLRGWTIEIGTSSGGEFRTSEILQLSQSDEWAAVPAGTILTFIEKNSANGGLDTGLRLRDNLTSTGEAWSNIWLGDPDLLVYTDEATNGYTLDGGTVEGIGINQNSTQFLIRNALDQAVFGPAGEGIAPQSGVSSTETFRLQSNPSPAVLPLTESINGNPGYSAASADSTFGQPNRWQDAFNNQVVQTFSAYIVTPTPYENWANTFGLTGDAALGSADPDLDGRSNLAEYAFGGNPTAIDAAPAATLSHDGTEATWQFVRRDDDSLDLRLQRSTDLSDWSTVSPVSRSHNAHPSLNGFVLETITVSPDPENGREFFRVLANEAQ